MRLLERPDPWASEPSFLHAPSITQLVLVETSEKQARGEREREREREREISGALPDLCGSREFVSIERVVLKEQ